MNSVITVGLSGPAPPATATSPPADTGSGAAEPFAAVLQGTGPNGPASVGTGGEPPGPEPGSLDLTSLVQQLLGGAVAPGDQTMTEPGQPDRLAGAGTSQTEDAGELAAEEMLVALMPQLAIAADEPAASPLVALPVAAAAVQQGDVRTTSTLRGAEAVAVPVDVTAGAAVAVEASADAPPVIVPAGPADAAALEGAAAAAPEVEQQQALPLTPTGDDGSSTTSTAEAVEELAPAALEAPSVEAVADEGVVERPAPEPVRTDAQSSVSRDPATATNVDAAEGSIVSTQPATANTRSTTPVSATDPAATPASTEVFTAELASTVRRASMLGDQEVRLLLNPPELGHLDIRVIESPQGLRVVLEATSAEARELIEQQLPALRNALEARDLKVERLQVEQALDASALDEQSERGLRQDGQGESGSDQPGQDAAPWSPVAAMSSDETTEPGAAGATSGSESNTRNAAGDGQLDVLA